METKNIFTIELNFSKTAREKAFVDGKIIPEQTNMTVNVDDLSKEEREYLLSVTNEIGCRFEERVFCYFNNKEEHYCYKVDDYESDIHDILCDYKKKEEAFLLKGKDFVRRKNNDFLKVDYSWIHYISDNKIFSLHRNDIIEKYNDGSLKSFIECEGNDFQCDTEYLFKHIENKAQEIEKERIRKEKELKERKEEERKKAEERSQKNKALDEKRGKWVQEHGSSELKFALKRGLECVCSMFDKEYVDANYPDFEIDDEIEVEKSSDITVQDVHELMVCCEEHPDDKIEIVYSDEREEKYLKLDSEILSVYIYRRI